MKKCPKYFLAANSGAGFVSYFSECYDAKKGWKAYIIKGGPGTGKSTFMRQLLKKGTEKGYGAEIFPCSSDPDSLDAVIFKDIKIAVLDGTAPHVVDPKYPGVCDSILNFGEFWDEGAFEGKKKQIIDVTNENKSYHKTASRYIIAAGKVFEDNYNLSFEFIDLEKINSFTEKLCRKYIRPQQGKPNESIRFLSGITPKGVVLFADTVNDFYKEKVIIRDDFGAVSNSVMNSIREKCLKNGLDFIIVKNHFLPNITDHILIPDLSLAFLRESKETQFDTDTRRIHAKRFIKVGEFKKYKQRISLNKKLIRELTDSAVEFLKSAKESHDRLESYYISAMDYSRLNEFTSEFSDEIFR